MRDIAVSFGRALWSQMHPRMMLVTVTPFLAAVVLWGIILWFGFQPAINSLHAYFSEHDGFRIAHDVLGPVGLDALRIVLAPLIAMWLLLPLMIFTALAFISLFAMPTVERHVSSRHYPQLEKRHGGNLWGSVATALTTLAVFFVLWIVTTPLALIPPFGFIIHPVLWGWMAYRVMGYDALAAHADAEERAQILRAHRWPLMAMGIATGLAGTAPTLMWLGSVWWVALFPFLAAFSIWLYVLFFVFSGLWFQHYCLAALQAFRAGGRRIVDINPVNEKESDS